MPKRKLLKNVRTPFYLCSSLSGSIIGIISKEVSMGKPLDSRSDVLRATIDEKSRANIGNLYSFSDLPL